MRCAAAGNSLVLKTAPSESQLLLTHHRSPPSSKQCRRQELSTSGCNGEESWADGPARWSSGRTPVSATLWGGADNTERILNNPTPSFEGRSYISEPARSQPQSSAVPDN
ncbi:MAG: hypothetical protein A07HR60_01801 [uncultured archaeon A07HR60]|nr:MAG: hypothetical protein A07HR60_01801 [uncultured archaeon A07HR60]